MPSPHHIVATAHPAPDAASALRVAARLAEATGARLTVYPIAERLAPFVGMAGIEIPRFAEHVQADLVVLPRISFAGEQLADAVTRRSHVPSLSVGSGFEDLDRWLIALDGTPRCRMILLTVAPIVEAMGGRSSSFQVRNGDVFEGILREQSATGAGVLAIGSRPGGPPPPIPEGSLARRLVNAARCMVLTVPI
jgi:nucleotide-binding universal stress UspA family protein